MSQSTRREALGLMGMLAALAGFGLRPLRALSLSSMARDQRRKPPVPQPPKSSVKRNGR